MLEVKDLYREYKPKNGAPVVALNHVNIKFPDKGLVFILGKSGSGKSTLLNVMGGLDKADGGDIIIKGKSSANFKQSDFDSYRNTYLGFIFQEYNILDEFNVGQNIALAIELQGRKATSKEINEILDEVDLKGYGNRKTNELSGGQKQRVAIARALVKDPDIIFGDEPTGALDSKTGLAVFDTLKKLAEHKLVIVVSHDREFAELYGDRVIELADGSIISDIEKIKVEGEKKSEGLTLIDQTVIKVDRDYELTDSDMEVIKKYLNERKNQERLISLDDSINGSLRRITRIDELGNKESFTKTDESKITNKKEEFKAIKSKLSLKKCFRIGASSLKTKPFRLVITILLSITAFAMFGLADTLGSYDKVESTTKSVIDLSNNSIALEKKYYYKYNEDDNYFNNSILYVDDNDLITLKDKYNLDFKGVYRITRDTFGINNYKKSVDNYFYNNTYSSGYYVSNEEELNELGFTLYGNYPTDSGEIAITRIMYESFKKYGYYYRTPNTGSEIEILASDITEDKLIGNKLSLDNGNSLTITGIIDTKFNDSKYSKLIEAKTNDVDFGIYMLKSQFDSDYKYGYHSLFFTNQKTVNRYANISQITSVNTEVKINDNAQTDYSIYDINKTGYKVKYQNYKETNNNIGFSFRMFNYFGISFYDIPINENVYRYDYMDDDVYLSNIDSAGTALDYIGDSSLQLVYDCLIRNNKINISYDDFYDNLVDQLFPTEIINSMLQKVSIASVSIQYYSSYGRYTTTRLFENESFNVSAIVFDNNSSGIYFDDSVISRIDTLKEPYLFAIAHGSNDNDKIKQIVTDTYKEPEDGVSRFKLQNAVMPAYQNISDTVENLSQVFLYIGIGFAVFASLMLFNFISISISYKKKEIGILRAVGARSKDVFNIFFSESFIIAMIAFLFAITITFVISIVINNSLVNNYNLMMTLLMPGVRQVLLVLAVSLGVAFISTFLPVYKIAMKRPIDAIRDR